MSTVCYLLKKRFQHRCFHENFCETIQNNHRTSSGHSFCMKIRGKHIIPLMTKIYKKLSGENLAFMKNLDMKRKC